MKLAELKTYLAAHGVEDGSAYTHGGLGGGEIQGIEEIDGVWHTYFSERGSKTGYRAWDTEEEAVAYVLKYAEKFAHAYKFWKVSDAHITPDQVHAYFGQHGLKNKKDYVLHGLRPKGPLPLLSEMPGLEFHGKSWYTYYALPQGKNSLLHHATFQDAAKWVIRKTTRK